MPRTKQPVRQLIKRTVLEFLDDNGPRLAAGMAFTAMFATAPIVLIAIQIASRLLGEAARGGSLAGVLTGFVGPQIAHTIQSLVVAARPHPASSVPAALINGAVLLYVAFFGFAEIQNGMNVMWGVRPKPEEPWWRMMLLRRLPAFGLVFLPGLLLVLGVFVASAAASVASLLRGSPESGLVASSAMPLFNFGASWLVIGLIFGVLPDGRVPFRDLALGSLVTAILWAAGTYVFELYLPRVDFSSVYGAAGSLVALLVWVNYMSQVVLAGAKFTRVLARGRGEPVRPAPYAARVKHVLIADES